MVLEETAEEQLLQKEQWWADILNSCHSTKGLNILEPSNRVGTAGRKTMRDKGIKRIVSDDTKSKMSKSQKGRKVSAQGRINMSAGQMGKFFSTETRKKMSISWVSRKIRGKLDISSVSFV